MTRFLILGFLCPFWLLACSLGDERAAAPVVPATVAAAPASALDKLVLHDRVAIAGQPSAEDLRTLAGRGYSHIINVRTPAEMADRELVPFDESALAAELGLHYQMLPVGGDQPFRPEVPDEVYQALKDPQAKVLLHCASGGRASQVYAAYAVQHLGMEVDQALRLTEAFGGWPLPLERMTGIRLKVTRADE
jgi:uncharacterized protein (TIGR01244 family)